MFVTDDWSLMALINISDFFNIFPRTVYTLFQNLRYFNILLFTCKLALIALFKEARKGF